jgi:hypothetical protein
MTMFKYFGTAMLAVALMASPVLAGGACCGGKTASKDKAMCTDFASLNVTANQKAKLEAWQSDCLKAGCTKESRAKFMKQAKGILSADQYAKLKAQCTKSAKRTET